MLPVEVRRRLVGRASRKVCREPGISDATFYNWHKKYGGLGPSDLRRLKKLEEENAKLKRLVADVSLDKATNKVGPSCARILRLPCGAEGSLVLLP